MNDRPIVTLNDLIDRGVIELGRGKVISKRDLAATPGTYPVYSSAKQNQGKFGEYGEYMFDEELITWSVDGGGRLFHRPKHRFSVTNVGGTIRILDHAALNYKYLYYVLTHLHSQIDFDWVKKAHPSVIRKLYNDIPLPPLSEQRRIVSVLDTAFAGLATATANTQKNLQNARELFETYLNQLFNTGGQGWTESKLDQIAENLDRKRVPITKSKRKPGPIPYYGASGVVDHVAEHIFDEDLLLISEDGANLLARTYPIAFSISGKTWVNNHAHVLRFSDPNLREWVETYINHIPIDDYVTGAAQPKLNQKALNSIPILLPPEDEVRGHVEMFAEMRSMTDRVAEIADAKLAALEELKQSILHRAFRGELSEVLLAS